MFNKNVTLKIVKTNFQNDSSFVKTRKLKHIKQLDDNIKKTVDFYFLCVSILTEKGKTHYHFVSW